MVTTIKDGQQKMGGVIERISTDLQVLSQKDADPDGEGDGDLVLVSTNLDAPESAPARTLSIGARWSWLAGIPEEEESSVKDYVTSTLP